MNLFDKISIDIYAQLQTMKYNITCNQFTSTSVYKFPLQIKSLYMFTNYKIEINRTNKN